MVGGFAAAAAEEVDPEEVEEEEVDDLVEFVCAGRAVCVDDDVAVCESLALLTLLTKSDLAS